MSKIMRSLGFLGILFGLLMKVSLPLMKKALKPIAKTVVIP